MSAAVSGRRTSAELALCLGITLNATELGFLKLTTFFCLFLNTPTQTSTHQYLLFIVTIHDELHASVW